MKRKLAFEPEKQFVWCATCSRRLPCTCALLWTGVIHLMCVVGSTRPFKCPHISIQPPLCPDTGWVRTETFSSAGSSSSKTTAPSSMRMVYLCCTICLICTNTITQFHSMVYDFHSIHSHLHSHPLYEVFSSSSCAPILSVHPHSQSYPHSYHVSFHPFLLCLIPSVLQVS